MRNSNGLNSFLERWLPEQRLFLKSNDSTRFVRLSPTTQLLALGGGAAFFGWALIATSILAIDAITSHSNRDHARMAQGAFETRLTDLSTERDARAAEAVAAQERFTVALDQVSRMQSQLLESEARRHEAETGLEAVQNSLQIALHERDTALGADDKDGKPASTEQAAELKTAFDILSGELSLASEQRNSAVAEAGEAKRQAEALAVERDQIIAHNDEILGQLEDAVTISVKPLDDMFRNAGMDPESVLNTIRKGYSGEGGPLNPVSYSSSGNAEITQREAKAKEILVTLDKMNSYRIAVEKMPLAMPVQSAFRYTSPFGRRWGRAHEGIDMAGPVGTPIYATADGVVIHAGRLGAYGNLIKIQHEMGIETRFGHLSKIKVKVGQKVSRGSLIGAMGNTGRSTGPHLHYEVRVNGRAMNPMSFIKAAQNVF